MYHFLVLIYLFQLMLANRASSIRAEEILNLAGINAVAVLHDLAFGVDNFTPVGIKKQVSFLVAHACVGPFHLYPGLFIVDKYLWNVKVYLNPTACVISTYYPLIVPFFLAYKCCG